ncbi:MAG: hypothetical protein GY761_15050 [Hyphomicrobiales bacterium]|nr:hypothetical protein [Hyphomicrobiales bacterium]
MVSKVASTNISRDGSAQLSANAGAGAGTGKIVMWTLLFQLAWSWNSLRYIVTQGSLPGPDDFMRLFQVRSLLSGQSWYDSTAYRMLPPDGADIHWSRLIDAPIAGLIHLMSPLMGQQLAERLTTIVWPTIILVLTVLVITKICDSLFSRYNRLLPVFFTVLCTSSLAQFVPGRIDHHNVQILLYIGLLWCLVNWQKPHANISAGIIIPLSISIGLDVLVFFILLMAWFGMEWAFGFDKNGKSLRRFALSLAAVTLVLYPVNIAPDQWFAAHCDANSLVFLSAQLSIALSMLVMSFCSQYLSSNTAKTRIISRLTLAFVLAVGCALILLAVFPACIGGPYAAVSDELNSRWLSQVSEAKNLMTMLNDYPEYWIKTVGYCALIFATGAWLLSKNLENKTRMAMIYAAFLASVLLAIIQYRTIRIGFFAAIPICVLASELITRKLIDRFGGGSLPSMAGQVASVIVLSTASWAFVGTLLLAKPAQSLSVDLNTDIENQSANILSMRKTCFLGSDYELLASLPQGHVISGLNSAPAILIFTNKSIVAGPYHRNQQGILDVMDFFFTDVDKAHQIARQHKLDYVALCRSPNSKSRTQTRAGQKIANLKYNLLMGNLPSWLHRLSAENDKLLVFGVKN